MTILVIIVTYNGENWLDICLGQLYNLDNIEIIIIDNNSKDNTVEIIKEKFPLVYLIESNINLGFGKANNLGFEYAIENDFSYVFLLNQDASIDYENMLRLIKTYEKDASIGILSPIHYKNDTEIENIFKFYIKDSKVDLNSDHPTYEMNFVNAALWLISVENLKRIGGFNPVFFHYGEDVEYVNRVKYFRLLLKIDRLAKGYHFREYTIDNFKKKFDKSRYFGPWDIKYNILLTNVNNSYFVAVYQSFKLFIKSFIKYFIKGYFSASLLCLKVYKNVFINMFKIHKNRKIIKNNKKPFLKT